MRINYYRTTLIISTEFRPPTMYYTTIPLVSERPHNRRWDASKLRELRKRMDTSTISIEEIDNVAADFLDGEIVDLASDWLGNTVSPLDLMDCTSPDPIFPRSFKNYSRSALLVQGWPCSSVLPPTWP